MPKFVQRWFGLWNIIPEMKVTQANRGVEVNCSENIIKQSLTLRLDTQYAFCDRLFNLIFGHHVGLQTKEDENGIPQPIKPNIFAMAFTYNPKNFLYFKTSLK